MWLLLLSLIADTAELEAAIAGASEVLTALNKNPLFIKLKKIARYATGRELVSRFNELVKHALPKDIQQLNEHISQLKDMKKHSLSKMKSNISNYFVEGYISSWVLMAKWTPAVQDVEPKSNTRNTVYGTLSWCTKTNPSKLYTTPDIREGTWDILVEAAKKGEFGTALWHLQLFVNKGLDVSAQKRLFADRKAKVSKGKYRKVKKVTQKVGKYGK